MDNLSIDLRLVDFGSSVKANADVTLGLPEGDLTIKGFRVIQQDGKDPWVAMPTNSYKDKSGEFKNLKIIEMPRRLKDPICNKILELYRAQIK